MRVLITGLNGTLAPHVARQVTRDGHEVIPWDRAAFDPHAMSDHAIAQHLDHLAVAGIIHLGMGAPAWAAALAGHARDRGYPFVFTSTAMVFDASGGGPHAVDDPRTASDDYGRYKVACEDEILAANPASVIARLGYQIDLEQASGNNMVAHLHAQAAQGAIRASRAWVPATSLMDDTASGLAGLFALAQQGAAAGCHHLDSNASTAWTYPRIVAAVSQSIGARWIIEETDDYAHDQRLVPAQRADTVVLPDLEGRLAN